MSQTTPPPAPANRQQLPDHPITIGGKTYVMRFGFRAVAALEDIYDLPMKKLGLRFQGKALEEIRVSDVRNMFWAACREHHPDMTPDQALDILDGFLADEGKMDFAVGEIFKAFGAAGEDRPAGDPPIPPEREGETA